MLSQWLMHYIVHDNHFLHICESFLMGTLAYDVIEAVLDRLHRGIPCLERSTYCLILHMSGMNLLQSSVHSLPNTI